MPAVAEVILDDHVVQLVLNRIQDNTPFYPLRIFWILVTILHFIVTSFTIILVVVQCEVSATKCKVVSSRLWQVGCIWTDIVLQGHYLIFVILREIVCKGNGHLLRTWIGHCIGNYFTIFVYNWKL